MAKRILSVLAVCVFMGMMNAAAGVAEEAYRVGCSMAVTGPGAGTYAPIKDALDIYFKDVNDRGGINGHPVEILIEDDAAQPSKAAANAKKFATQKEVILTILASLSSTYAPVMQVSDRYDIPLFFGGGVCPDSVYPPDPKGNQFCTTSFGAKYDSRFAVAYMKEQAGEGLSLGLAAMNIPVSRGEIDFAEELAKDMGIRVVDKEITPPPTPDYTPFATKLKNAGANWVYAWAPWGMQVRTFQALRKIGWEGKFLAYGHIQAEDELLRLKDDGLYVFGTNAFFSDNSSVHQKIKAAAGKAKSIYPYTQLLEGWIVAMALEEILKNTSWPPTPDKVRAAMEGMTLDLQGLKGGPMTWTGDNHFRTVAHYRVYKWDSGKGAIIKAKDWTPIEVK